MSKVASQYNEWVYPIPIENMRAAIANGTYWEIGDPILYYPLFWPRRRDAENLDILVAGCGSVQAAYYACRNPSWNVIGIDLSDSSLAHQRKLKDLHGLENLQLQKLDIIQVDKLRKDFDFIVSTGVLHHLPDPDSGLSALKQVLRPEGVMNLMVYGKSLRLGVYMLQEVFRTLGLQQTKKDVEIVKATINSLPADHVVRRYVNNAGDLHFDAAFVDTFLHTQDRAYTVNEIYDLTRKAGLDFLSWCDPAEYSLETNVPKEHQLWSKFDGLSPQSSAQICDLLTQSRGTHRWAVGHPSYVKSCKIPFYTDAFLDCCIRFHRQTEFLQRCDTSNGKNTICKRGNIRFEIDTCLVDLIDLSKGILTIKQAVEKMSLTAEEKNRVFTLTHKEFERLWKQGHIYIFLPN